MDYLGLTEGPAYVNKILNQILFYLNRLLFILRW